MVEAANTAASRVKERWVVAWEGFVAELGRCTILCFFAYYSVDA